MTAPLRFCMVASGYPPARNGGLERGCQRLAEALGRRGHRVLVLTQCHDAEPAEREEAPGVSVARTIRPLAAGPLWGISYARQVRRFLLGRAAEWDVAMCHKLYLHSAVAPGVARRLGRTAVNLLVSAGEFSDIRTLRQLKGGSWLVRASLDAHAQFALSDLAARELHECGVPAERIWRYRYFTDTERFAPAAERDGSELLFIGRFHSVKNVPLLVAAFGDADVPGGRLRLIGAGPAEEDVRAAVAASPVRDRITIEGWTQEPAAAYQRAGAMIMTSDAEGLSNVLVESLACGTPAITTDVSGARDALDPQLAAPRTIPPGDIFVGEGGIIAPIGDRAAVAKAIRILMGDATMRAELARKARARALANYSEEASIAAFLNAIARIRVGETGSAAERGFADALFTGGAP